MDYWSKNLFHLGFLILALGRSTEEDMNADTSKIAYALSNVSRALECFGESTRASLGHQSAVLQEFGNILQESLRLQRENSQCVSSVEKLKAIVLHLRQKNEDLESQLNKTQETVDHGCTETWRQRLEKDHEFADSKFAAGYQFFPGYGFYKFFPQAVTWPEAVENCRAEGAHLGIINSGEEANVYSLIIKTHPKIEGADFDNYFLIGISAIPGTRDFHTLNGVPLSDSGYSEWDYGEPNNVNYPEECGTINYEVRFNDVPCTMRFAYICEIEYL